MNNDLFMSQWEKLNQNVTITVNRGSAIYYNNIENIGSCNNKIILTYHIVNKKKVGYKKQIEYYENSNNIKTEKYWFDGKSDGVWRSWYDNIQHRLESEGLYFNGKSDGIWRKWYDDDQHTLMFENYYVNDEGGVQRHWYNNNQHTLKSEEHYINGRRDGVWRKWYDNDQQTEGILREPWLRHTLEAEQSYANGRRDGVWRKWYNNNQQTEGILREPWLRHTLYSEGYYVNDEEDGIWRHWYDDDQHTLKAEQHFVNGKRHGRYVVFNIDGSIASDDIYVNGIEQ